MYVAPGPVRTSGGNLQLPLLSCQPTPTLGLLSLPPPGLSTLLRGRPHRSPPGTSHPGHCLTPIDTPFSHHTVANLAPLLTGCLQTVSAWLTTPRKHLLYTPETLHPPDHTGFCLCSLTTSFQCLPAPLSAADFGWNSPKFNTLTTSFPHACAKAPSQPDFTGAAVSSCEFRSAISAWLPSLPSPCSPFLL